jgi:hypothetical protein
VTPVLNATHFAQTTPDQLGTLDAYARPFGTNRVAETISVLKNYTAVVAPEVPMRNWIFPTPRMTTREHAPIVSVLIWTTGHGRTSSDHVRAERFRGGF